MYWISLWALVNISCRSDWQYLNPTIIKVLVLENFDEINWACLIQAWLPDLSQARLPDIKWQSFRICIYHIIQMFRIWILTVTYILFSRAITSTPSHLQVDHFLDSVLENSNSNDLLQTPRRHSPPPSPPGGMSEHSWLPELSLSSFLGSLPTENGATESPSKMLSHAEDSIQSTGSEVDRQLTMMLNENSLDFTSKFAHLASALNSTD